MYIERESDFRWRKWGKKEEIWSNQAVHFLLFKIHWSEPCKKIDLNWKALKFSIVFLKRCSPWPAPMGVRCVQMEPFSEIPQHAPSEHRLQPFPPGSLLTLPLVFLPFLHRSDHCFIHTQRRNCLFFPFSCFFLSLRGKILSVHNCI